MNPAPYLAQALKELDKSMQGTLEGTKIECISKTISHYAIASAVASSAAGVIPGVAGVAAALTQTGIVWATYVKINKTIGLSMSQETAKFLGNAIITNLVTQFGAIIVGHIAASIIALVPVIGSVVAVAAEAAIGYCLIYAAAYIYIKLISIVLRPDGTLDVSNEDKTSEIIKNIMNKDELKGVFKEGSKQFKAERKSGSFNALKDKLLCEKCNTEYQRGDKYCSICGHQLSK